MISKPAAIALVVLVIAVALFGSGWYTGRAGMRAAIAEAEKRQLNKDAKESAKIDRKADERREITIHEVEVIREAEPDWVTRRLPDIAVDRLRDRGLTRPETP